MNVLEWQRVSQFANNFGNSATVSIHLGSFLKKLVLFNNNDDYKKQVIQVDFMPSILLIIEDFKVKPLLFFSIFYVNGLREYSSSISHEYISKPFTYSKGKYHNKDLSKNAYKANFTTEMASAFLGNLLGEHGDKFINPKTAATTSSGNLNSLADFIGSVHSMVASLLSEFDNYDIRRNQGDSDDLSKFAQLLHVKFSMFDPKIVCSSKSLLRTCSESHVVSIFPVFKKNLWTMYLSTNHYLPQLIDSVPIFEWQLMDGSKPDKSGFNYNEMYLTTGNFESFQKIIESDAININLNQDQLNSLQFFSFNSGVDDSLVKKQPNSS